MKLYTTPEAYPVWYTNADAPVLVHKKELLSPDGLRYSYCVLEGGVVKSFERANNSQLVKIFYEKYYLFLTIWHDSN